MHNIPGTYNFGFYTTSNKNKSNYITYHEPTKIYPSNSGRININLNSYKIGNINYDRQIHSKKNLHESQNPSKKKTKNCSNIKNKDNINVEQMFNSLKNDIIEISNNTKEVENKCDYYINKNNEDQKKIRSNSANISKNLIFLPSKNKNTPAIIKNKGMSIEVDKKPNYIYNDYLTDFLLEKSRGGSSSSKNLKYNSENDINKNMKPGSYSYNIYSKKSNLNLNNNSPNNNKLTIQINNKPNHNNHNINTKFNPNRNTISKKYNNYVNYKDNNLNINSIFSSKPMYHTAQNFYRGRGHNNKKKKNNSTISNVNRTHSKNCKNFSSLNNNLSTNKNTPNNKNNNKNLLISTNNKASEKSSVYLTTNYQDYINDSIKKIPNSSSSYRNNLTIKNNSQNRKLVNKSIKYEIKNKINKLNFNKGDSLEKNILDLKNKISSSNNMIPGIVDSAHSMKQELDTLKVENEQLRIKLILSNNVVRNNKKLLQKENKEKDEQITNLKKEIRKLNSTLNIKESIISILKSNTNNNKINESKHNGSEILIANIKNLENEVSNLRYNLNEKKSQDYLNLETKNEDLVRENTALKKQIQNLINKYYNKEQKKIENDIIQKDKKIQILLMELATIKNEKKNLEEEIKNITLNSSTKLNKQIITINKYIQENKSLIDLNAELTEKISYLTDLINANELKYQSIIVDLNKKLTENSQNSQNYEKMTKDLENNEKTIIDLNEKIKILENNNEELSNKNNLLNNSLQVNIALNNDLKEENNKLKLASNENNSKENNYNNIITELKEEIKEKEIVINDLYKQINDFNYMKSKSDNNEENDENEENEILNQQIEDLQKKLNECNSENEKLEIKCSDLEEEIDKLNELMNIKQEENKSLKEKINGLMQQIKTLQEENESLKNK